MTGLIDVIGVRIAPGVPATRLPLSSEWIVVSNRARSMQIGGGKDQEIGRTQAGTATVVLDDRDRVLDPVNTVGPYYPDLQPMMWIELSYDSTVKFTGYCERFDVSWPGGPYAPLRGDAITTIAATDIFKLASLGDLVSYPTTVLADGPVGYWRLNEFGPPAKNIGSQQDAGVAGMNFDLISVPGTVTFGSLGGPLGNNKTVADFVGAPNVLPLSQNLIRTASSAPGPAPAWTAFQSYTVGARVSYQGNIYVAKVGGSGFVNVGYPPFDSPAVWTWVPSLPDTTGTIWRPSTFEMWLDPRTLIADTGIAGLYEYTAWPGTTSAIPWRIFIDAGGALRMEWSSGGGGGTFAGATVATTPSPANLLIANGGWQHIIAVVDGSVVTWYRNGAFHGTSVAPVASTSQEYNLNLAVLALGAAVNPGLGYDGRMAHFALHPGKLSPSRIIAHYTSTADTVEEALSGSQIDSLLDALLIPDTMRDIDPGASTMQAFEPSGSALDRILQIAEDSERGIFIASPTGKFTFIDRNSLMEQGDPVATYGDAGVAIGTGDGYGVARYGIGQYEDFFVIGTTEIGYTDLQLTETDVDLKTLVSATRENGTEQVAWDQATSVQKGVRTLALTGLAFASDADAAAAAGYLLARFRLSQQRPQQMTIMGSDPVKKAEISKRAVGDLITVVRRPAGGGSPISMDVTIQGLQHSWAVGTPWTTTYRLDLPPNTGTWVIGDSELGSETVLGWGDPEPEGEEWIQLGTFSDGDRMSLKDYSVLARRDPLTLRKAHAVRYYYPNSQFVVPPTVGTPEIQRFKFRNGTATGGTFVVSHPVTLASTNALPWNVGLSAFRAAFTGTRGGFWNGAPYQVNQAAISVPLNHGGFLITIGHYNLPVPSVGVDSSGLSGDTIGATVEDTVGSLANITLDSFSDQLVGGTFQLIIDGTASTDIPWDVETEELLQIITDMNLTFPSSTSVRTVTTPSGLKDGFDMTVFGLGNVPLLTVNNTELVGDTIDVIPIQDGDLSFTTIPLVHADQSGRRIDTDNMFYPMQLGKLPGRWWLHGQVRWQQSANLFTSYDASVIIRRNGTEVLATGGEVYQINIGYTYTVEVSVEVDIVEGDYIEMGFTDPNQLSYLMRGSEATYLEAVWMGA